MNTKEFAKWFLGADFGDRIAYFEGERLPDLEIKYQLWKMCRQGKLFLSQERCGDRHYVWWAEKISERTYLRLNNIGANEPFIPEHSTYAE